MKQIYLAGGCFWGTQHLIKQLHGVIDTETGYANGKGEHPTYEEVYTDRTGFAETVRVVYDPEQLTLEHLLRLYFRSIDPTACNRQGEDVGTRYRTGIYYTNEDDLPTIRACYAEVEAAYNRPLAVEVTPLVNFYAAEPYHQDYLDKHPDGYCHIPHALIEEARKIRN